MNNEFKRMQQLAGIKEINLQPKMNFTDNQQLAEYIEKNPKFKLALLDAIYEAEEITPNDGSDWIDLKPAFLNNPIIDQGGWIEFESGEEDSIVVSLTPGFSDEKMVEVNGIIFYYGLN